MLNQNALRGFAVGVSAAIIVVLGVWPVLAHDSGQLLLPAGHELAPHADGSPGGSPGAEELDRVAADEVTEQGFGGSSPLVIPAAAFRNDGDDPQDYFFYFWGGYVRGKDPNTDSTFMMAPAYLPDGATVTSVYAYLYDNDSSEDIDVTLTRARNMTGVTDVMAYVYTSGTSTGIQYLGATTISPSDVSNFYSYYVTVELPSSSTRLWAVRIFYEYSAKTYLPIIWRSEYVCSPDNYEPNDSCTQAYGPLTSGQTYQSWISDCDLATYKKSDYFYIETSTTNAINIYLTNIPAGTDYDLYLYRNPSDDPSSPAAKSEGTGSSETISYSPPTAWKYYIRVYGRTGSSTSQYSLRVTYD